MALLRSGIKQFSTALIGVSLLVLLQATTVSAANPGPQSSSVGLEATIPSPPPSKGATIAIPSSGTSVSSVPLSISGSCPNGLLVKVFTNNIFIGSSTCTNGGYSIQVSLLSGQNDIIARVYDALDQAGPDSNTVTITFNDAQFAQFGTQVALSSIYAQRGAAPGTDLSWPIQLINGTGPYAISVDWGDGTPTDLLSIINSGTFNIKHSYKTAGVYKVIIKATDKNGGVAFLQLVGQGTGIVTASSSNTIGPKASTTTNTVSQKEIVWWPALVMLPLILAAFWLGKHHELYLTRRQFGKIK
ncbi:MAG: hypothetical protein NVS1B10_00750 [Candidatus Saccharimonadales bacterium]